MAETWHVSRESAEWVGPVVVTVTEGGAPVPTPEIKFAVLPKYHRPAPGDWAAPYLDPELPGTALGVFVDPVTAYGRYGIWVQVTDTPETPVLEPAVVGWIVRT